MNSRKDRAISMVQVVTCDLDCRSHGGSVKRFQDEIVYIANAKLAVLSVASRESWRRVPGGWGGVTVSLTVYGNDLVLPAKLRSQAVYRVARRHGR